jgi:hypothetical protein
MGWPGEPGPARGRAGHCPAMDVDPRALGVRTRARTVGPRGATGCPLRAPQQRRQCSNAGAGRRHGGSVRWRGPGAGPAPCAGPVPRALHACTSVSRLGPLLSVALQMVPGGAVWGPRWSFMRAPRTPRRYPPWPQAPSRSHSARICAHFAGQQPFLPRMHVAPRCPPFPLRNVPGAPCLPVCTRSACRRIVERRPDERCGLSWLGLLRARTSGSGSARCPPPPLRLRRKS